MVDKHKSEFSRLQRGDVTTISIPKKLKEHIDKLKNESETYSEFLTDFFSPDLIERLDELRGEDESYGDIIRILTSPADHDRDERLALIDSALGNSEVVDQSTTEVRFGDG